MSRLGIAWRTRDWVAPPEKIGTVRVRPIELPSSLTDTLPGEGESQLVLLL